MNKRWCAISMGCSGQLQCGEGNLFILCRYERKLPWFVRNQVIRKFGQRGREKHVEFHAKINL